MNTKLKIIGRETVKLMIDDHWQVQIPVDLRERFGLKCNDWVEISFSNAYGENDEDIEGLIDALEQEGFLITVPYSQLDE